MIEVSKLPQFDGMTPKQMRRAWAVFMADHDWVAGELHDKAEFIRLAIESLIMNDGTPGEIAAQKDLEQRLATFSAAWPHR